MTIDLPHPHLTVQVADTIRVAYGTDNCGLEDASYAWRSSRAHYLLQEYANLQPRKDEFGPCLIDTIYLVTTDTRPAVRGCLVGNKVDSLILVEEAEAEADAPKSLRRTHKID